MECKKNINNNELDLTLIGKFTFVDHSIFKPILEDIEKNTFNNITINLSGIEFIDSAALGILLLVKDSSDKNNISLVLKSPSGQVKKMFEVTRFYDLFTIND
jgi:HptB-dependent secretion and biofilm anti anti-sigma factor